MRRKQEEQLQQLNAALIEMGDTVEMAIADANKALVEQDVELAKKAIAFDDEIDHMEKEVESLCLRMIMQKNLAADELRLVSSVLKIITDLERIGDHAADISEITILLAEKKYLKKLEHISQMAEDTMKMVIQSIDAFVKKDIGLAREIIAADDQIDRLFMTVKGELVKMIQESADNGDQAIDLIMIAKYFERIGDHATNVAEWVVFSITGKHKEEQVI